MVQPRDFYLASYMRHFNQHKQKKIVIWIT